ncbi:conserved hypothetical protein [Crocosphaera subtropica ATCC 51142]|uniref:Uncharacterized protein n=1 Tax=Crocosphaera subtropica (strain ATCC 51142 / BH68) TaxID=43989 RepID=B1WQ06_CROS5|nr:hypothetical protein [Crocosphaera subtropica]ACB53321.1 conserved hypothetical protein [Crocosphaera subtropica ATCC 51142]
MKLSIIQNRKNSSGFQFNCLNWTGVTLIGFLCSLVWIEIGEVPDLNPFQAMIGATIIGCFQALVLSRFLTHPWLWILSSIMAWTLMGGSSFGLIGWFAPRTNLIMVRLTTGLILGSVTGIWVGFWQWFILKPVLSKSYLWILFSGISWSLSLSIGWIIGGILRSATHLFLGEVIGLIIVWLLVGIQTGIVLSYLLQQSGYKNLGK